MEFFDWLAPETLETNEVSLAVTGSWLALTLFLSSLTTSHAAIQLGIPSIDFLRQESRAGLGCCAVRLRAHCPMGFDPGSLEPLLAQWPTLAVGVAHRDSCNDIDLHWRQANVAWSGGLDSHREFSALWHQSWPAWNLMDERIFALPLNTKAGQIALEVLLGVVPECFKHRDLFFALPEPLDVVRILAGFEPLDPLTWGVLSGFGGLTYRLAPAPWWPRGPGSWKEGNGATLLGSMIARNRLCGFERDLAARRCLSISRADFHANENAGQAWLWDALNPSLQIVSVCAAWVLACHLACEAECRKFGETLHGARSPLSCWFDVKSLIYLAAQHPRNARALMLGCGADLCQYSVDELNELSMAAPEIGSLFTAQLLENLTTADPICGSGSTRL